MPSKRDLGLRVRCVFMDQDSVLRSRLLTQQHDSSILHPPQNRLRYHTYMRYYAYGTCTHNTNTFILTLTLQSTSSLFSSLYEPFRLSTSWARTSSRLSLFTFFTMYPYHRSVSPPSLYRQRIEVRKHPGAQTSMPSCIRLYSQLHDTFGIQTRATSCFPR